MVFGVVSRGLDHSRMSLQYRYEEQVTRGGACMTKAELIDKISEKKPGLTRKQVEVSSIPSWTASSSPWQKRTRSRSADSELPDPPPARQEGRNPKTARDGFRAS